MKKLWKIVGLILGIAFLFAFTASVSKAKRVQPYRITSGKKETLRVIKYRGWSIYDRLSREPVKAVRNTTCLKGRLIRIEKVARGNSRTYFLISYRGQRYGWIDSQALVKPKTYVLPFTYYSQLYPLWAPEACEATSLKMALSAKGLANNTGLKYIVDHMPKSSSSGKGFSGNPYKDNSGWFYWWNLIKHGFNGVFGQTIYPKPLAKYARKYYDPNARNITGASKARLISEVEHGNPVVFVGAFQMKSSRSYHILALVGYRPGQFLIADPYRYLGQKHRIFWVSTSKYMKIFNNRIRKRRAIVI